jgi:hypothetical protein
MFSENNKKEKKNLNGVVNLWFKKDQYLLSMYTVTVIISVNSNNLYVHVVCIYILDVSAWHDYQI